VTVRPARENHQLPLSPWKILSKGKGLEPGDRVIGKGSLFIDRVAAGTSGLGTTFRVGHRMGGWRESWIIAALLAGFGLFAYGIKSSPRKTSEPGSPE